MVAKSFYWDNLFVQMLNTYFHTTRNASLLNCYPIWQPGRYPISGYPTDSLNVYFMRRWILQVFTWFNSSVDNEMNFFETAILLINNHKCYLMSTVRWKSCSLQLSGVYGRPSYVHHQSPCQSMRTHMSPVSPSFKRIIFVAKSLRSMIQEWFVFGLNWEQNYRSATTCCLLLMCNSNSCRQVTLNDTYRCSVIKFEWIKIILFVLRDCKQSKLMQESVTLN